MRRAPAPAPRLLLPLMLLPLLASAGPAAAEQTALRPGAIGRGGDQDGQALLGTRPPELPALAWSDGKKRTLASLAGRVVLIRNFTNGCPFCASTLPALETIARDLGPRGLLVLGVYHPKPPRPVTLEEGVGHGRALGARFPIAVDPDWSLINRWWRERAGNDWTSVTWVLDGSGTLRYLHPGGEYHPGGGANHARCQDDEAALRTLLEGPLAKTTRGKTAAR